MRFSLLCCILFIGCLKSNPSTTDHSDPFEDPPVAAETCETAAAEPLTPVADSRFTPPTVDPPGWTGAIVYCSHDCQPCWNLVADLDWFCRQYPKWSIQSGDLSTANAHWVICDTEPQSEYPRIVFYSRGSPIGERIGYATGTWESRRDLLLEIIHDHPSAKR